jgi:hypothetical protein
MDVYISRYPVCRELFERERARLLDARASGVAYAAPTCSVTSTIEREPERCESRKSGCSLQQEASFLQQSALVARSNIQAAQAAPSTCSTPQKASKSLLNRERPLTTLSDFMSSGYSTADVTELDNPEANHMVSTGTFLPFPALFPGCIFNTYRHSRLSSSHNFKELAGGPKTKN